MDTFDEYGRTGQTSMTKKFRRIIVTVIETDDDRLLGEALTTIRKVTHLASNHPDRIITDLVFFPPESIPGYVNYHVSEDFLKIEEVVNGAMDRVRNKIKTCGVEGPRVAGQQMFCGRTKGHKDRTYQYGDDDHVRHTSEGVKVVW